MIRVLLADDHSVLREGMALILSVEDDIEVVGQACHGREALDLATDLVPDVVLMDIQMPVMDGIEATRELLAKTPATKVVILTTFEREDYLFDAVVAGASGFLLKNTEAEQIVEAVRAVHAGQALLSPEVTLPLLRRVAGEGTRILDGHDAAFLSWTSRERTWHATIRPPPRSSSGGSTRSQMSSRSVQRGAKGHPCGRASRFGGEPGMPVKVRRGPVTDGNAVRSPSA
jgi:DNA-binding NarL/FixJ family response regulator